MRLFAIVALLLIATPAVAYESALPGLEKTIREGNERARQQSEMMYRTLQSTETLIHNREMRNLLEESNTIQRFQRIRPITVLRDRDESPYDSSYRRDRRR